MEVLASALNGAVKWVVSQYDERTGLFWIDAERTLAPAIGTTYALDTIYSLLDPLPDSHRDLCKGALAKVAETVTDLPAAAALQVDFFHKIALPGIPGTVFYEDRRYVGAFLSTLALAQARDPSAISDGILQAGRILFRGVSDGWIDKSTHMWDDGRPLICFTQDALAGLVRYSLEYGIGREGDSQSGNPVRVFLCHSSGDKPQARELYNWLKSIGTQPWLDEKNLIPGQDWDFEISRSVRDSDIVIVCLSRKATTKAGYLQKEIRFALDVADEQPEGAVFLIPVRVENCEVPERLRRYHWVNLYEGGWQQRLVEAFRTRAATLGKRVPLWDDSEQWFASPEMPHRVRELQEQSPVVLDSESKERALVGDVISTVALAGQLSREFNVSDKGIDMEIEFKDDAGEATAKKLYLQLKSGDSYLRERKGDDAEIFTIKDERHARYWMDQAFPVLLVIRTSDGEVRWMEVRDCLKREGDSGNKPVKQIVFDGERFDVMSVRRWRERILSSAHSPPSGQ